MLQVKLYENYSKKSHVLVGPFLDPLREKLKENKLVIYNPRLYPDAKEPTKGWLVKKENLEKALEIIKEFKVDVINMAAFNSVDLTKIFPSSRDPFGGLTLEELNPLCYTLRCTETGRKFWSKSDILTPGILLAWSATGEKIQLVGVVLKSLKNQNVVLIIESDDKIEQGEVTFFSNYFSWVIEGDLLVEKYGLSSETITLLVSQGNQLLRIQKRDRRPR